MANSSVQFERIYIQGEVRKDSGIATRQSRLERIWQTQFTKLFLVIMFTRKSPISAHTHTYILICVCVLQHNAHTHISNIQLPCGE